MARGFGTVLGSASTDRIVTTVTANYTTTSFSLRFYRGSGSGGAAAGRLWDKEYNHGIYWWTVDSKIHFYVNWSTTIGDWSVSLPSAGAWHHLLLTYSTSSTANDPVIYIDGVSVTVTEVSAPSGTPPSTSDAIYVGNNGGYARVFDGSLAEFAVWNAILTAGNATSLAAKTLPTRENSVRSESFVESEQGTCNAIAAWPTLNEGRP